MSVLSQISNCQGLGRKNKHEILKTDREIYVRVDISIYLYVHTYWYNIYAYIHIYIYIRIKWMAD